MFSWFSFLTYAVVTAVTPGPNNIMSMSNGSRRGFKGALPFNFGILAGFSAVMILCTAFCSLLSTWIPRIKMPMLIVGACYMLYLAWETFHNSGTIEEHHSRDGLLSGFLLQFVNPKIYIYCIMSMEAYILPFYNWKSLPLLGFVLLLVFIGFIFTLLWSAFWSIFKWLFPNTQKLSIQLWHFCLSSAQCYIVFSMNAGRRHRSEL